MRMKSCPGTAVVVSSLLLMTGTSTEASIVVTNSEIAYEYVANTLDLQLHEESLDEYFGSAAAFTGGSDAWAWELTATNGVTAFNSMIKANSGNTALSLNFESDQVFSIGGEFMLLSSEGSPINGVIQLLLSDGSSYITTVSSEESFAGFLSDDVNITSLNIIGFGDSAPDVTALSSFTIGVIPAPASIFSLLALGGVGRRRRH